MGKHWSDINICISYIFVFCMYLLFIIVVISWAWYCALKRRKAAVTMGKLRWDMVPSLLACLPACHPHNAYLQLLYLCICVCVFPFILSIVLSLILLSKLHQKAAAIKIHLILFHTGCWHERRGGPRKIKIDKVGDSNIGDNDYDDGGGGGGDEDDDGYWWWRSWAKPCWHESRRREGRVKNLNNGFDTTPVQGTTPIMVQYTHCK